MTLCLYKLPLALIIIIKIMIANFICIMPFKHEVQCASSYQVFYNRDIVCLRSLT